MDIKLMNYGRGAGKTYTLKQWAVKNLNTRVLVTKHPDAYRGTNIHRHGNVWGYDSDPKQFLERISRGGGTEIAFDDFDLADIKHTQLLATVQVMGVKSVILATTHETMLTDASRDLNKKFGMGAKVGSWEPSESVETDAAKTWKLAESKPPKIEGAVAEGIIKAAGEIGREFIKQHNARVYETAKQQPFTIPEAPGFVFTRETPSKITFTNTSNDKGNPEKEPEDGEVEPIQKVKAKDLRMGDYIEGAGYVTGLSYPRHSHYTEPVFIISFERGTASNKIVGSVTTHADTLLDVDITKRK